MTTRLLVAVAAILFTGGQAMAWCYEGLGCDDSDRFSRPALRQLGCQALYEVRNGIYAQNGYCFKTGRAYEIFGNDGCWIDDARDVRLNSVERFNIAQIVAVERQRRC